MVVVVVVIVVDDVVDSVDDVVVESVVESGSGPAMLLLSREQAVRPSDVVGNVREGCRPGCWSCHASKVWIMADIVSSTQPDGPMAAPAPRSAKAADATLH